MFKVGDRVKVIKGIDGVDLAGKTGKVIDDATSSGWAYAIEMDEPFSPGHNCAGMGKAGRCRYALQTDQFELISSSDIKSKGGNSMTEIQENVAKVFEKTEDAVAVSREMKSGSPLLEFIILKTNKEAVLEEVRARIKEREAKNK